MIRTTACALVAALAAASASADDANATVVFSGPQQDLAVDIVVSGNITASADGRYCQWIDLGFLGGFHLCESFDVPQTTQPLSVGSLGTLTSDPFAVADITYQNPEARLTSLDTFDADLQNGANWPIAFSQINVPFNIDFIGDIIPLSLTLEIFPAGSVSALQFISSGPVTPALGFLFMDGQFIGGADFNVDARLQGVPVIGRIDLDDIFNESLELPVDFSLIATSILDEVNPADPRPNDLSVRISLPDLSGFSIPFDLADSITENENVPDGQSGFERLTVSFDVSITIDINALSFSFDSTVPNGINCPPCPADLDPPGGDGQLGVFDLVQYLTYFGEGNPIADWDDDGEFGFFDLIAYLTEYALGCAC